MSSLRQLYENFSRDELLQVNQENLHNLFHEHVSDWELNNRLVIERLVSKEEAKFMREMADKYAFPGEGYHGVYQPHNKKEHYLSYGFEAKDRIFDPELDPVFDVRRSILSLVRTYYNNPRIEIMLSQLAIRRTLLDTPDYQVDPPMSHPYHLDISPEDTEIRTHTGVLFLNDDFLGGNFMFQASDKTPFRAIAPSTGRFICFEAPGIYHGTSHIYNGERFVLIFWFTIR
jgi:hypothetical protein